jgi:hypothetical protein
MTIVRGIFRSDVVRNNRSVDLVSYRIYAVRVCPFSVTVFTLQAGQKSNLVVNVVITKVSVKYEPLVDAERSFVCWYSVRSRVGRAIDRFDRFPCWSSSFSPIRVFVDVVCNVGVRSSCGPAWFNHTAVWRCSECMQWYSLSELSFL